MYCPSCGTEERQTSQFCRACGSDMRTLRNLLQRPDSITVSAISAREEIGRAIATKIQTLKSASDLKKVAEEVLPEVEKFLESPAERRLRRLRAGVITAAVGLGVTIIMLLSKITIFPLVLIGWPAGLLVFLIGIGVIINGILFSIPPQSIPDRTLDRHSQFAYDQISNNNLTSNTSNINEQPISLFNNNKLQDNTSNGYLMPPPSVTEHTTKQLSLNKTVDEPVKRITAEIRE